MSDPHTEAIAINPNPQTAEEYLQRAWIHLALRDIVQAEADFTQSLSLNGQLADGYYGLGMIRKMQGEPDKAVRAFQEALALIQMDAYVDSPQRGTILRNLCKSQITMAQDPARLVAA